jgi:hypothetical protein
LPVRFAQPVPVAARVEHQESEAQLLDGVEGLYPEQLLFQRADEALRAAVALGFADERGARCDAEKGQLVQEAVEQEPDDEGYTVHSPTLPGSVSSGKTLEEAKPNIREAILRRVRDHPPLSKVDQGARAGCLGFRHAADGRPILLVVTAPRAGPASPGRASRASSCARIRHR